MSKFRKYFLISLVLWLIVEWTTAFNPDINRWLSYWPQIWIFYIGYPLLFAYLIYKRNWSDKKIFLGMIVFGGIIFEVIFFKNVGLVTFPLAFIFIPVFFVLYGIVTFMPKWIINGELKNNKKKLILMLVIWLLVSIATYKDKLTY